MMTGRGNVLRCTLWVMKHVDNPWKSHNNMGGSNIGNLVA